MDLRFWNYVIPDGSTTEPLVVNRYTCFGTMSFQMVLLPNLEEATPFRRFGTMSFQMVLLLLNQACAVAVGFGTMSFQMVLLR